MGRVVEFHPLFATDIAEAAAWYDLRGIGLGDRFCDAVQESLSTIIADPDANPILDGSIHYRQLRRFPFLIVYEANQSTLQLVHRSPYCPLARAVASEACVIKAMTGAERAGDGVDGRGGYPESPG